MRVECRTGLRRKNEGIGQDEGKIRVGFLK